MGTCGFMLAVYMANAGGAWDNAKKWVEAGSLVVAGVPVVKNGEDGIHAATVTGDTIGDPFKDTSGPSLNILMKLMTMISLVFAKEQFAGEDTWDKWYIAVIIAVVFMLITVPLTLWMRKQGFGKLELPAQRQSDGDAKEVNEMTSLTTA